MQGVGHGAARRSDAVAFRGAPEEQNQTRAPLPRCKQRAPPWDAEPGEYVEDIRGSGEAATIAAGPDAFSFRALAREQETVVEDARTGRPVARFPEALRKIVTHPNGGAWAGAVGNHLYILTLEGGDEGS